ncbi:hypothetical protein BHM03_00035155 [Ensete ventricosum]|nr:hypothetical protein BHM03_00035155 [Ensete ventricosum]
MSMSAASLTMTCSVVFAAEEKGMCLCIAIRDRGIPFTEAANSAPRHRQLPHPHEESLRSGMPPMTAGFLLPAVTSVPASAWSSLPSLSTTSSTLRRTRSFGMSATRFAIFVLCVPCTTERVDSFHLARFGLQSYPHKILTGRRDKMATMRQTNGLSGFTKRSESEYDCFGAGHSSTSISAALGMPHTLNWIPFLVPSPMSI